MSFSRNYNYKPDFNGQKRNDIKKQVFEESTRNLEMNISSRDVFPQFSEPDEYSFASNICNPSFKFGSSQSQHNNHHEINKANTIYNRTVNASNSKMSRPTSSNKYFPTFRQYNDEQFDDKKGCFGENQAKRKFSYSKESNHNESVSCDSSIVSNRSRKPPSKFSENSETKSREMGSNQQKNQKVLIGTRTRYLIGTVDQVIRWYKMVKNMEFELHYEIAGVLESKIKKDCMDLLFIRSESGHILQGVFYNIDRELPDLQLGKIITATGSMIGSNKLQIFDAIEISKDDFIATQRLAFLSQRSLQEALCTPTYQ
ncbi:uncharacterized protein [Halyomorpha halys]|uniref:uncharacterized protein isoform X2 n=1 Tax=Halyomorpha halys TaxID=286706 RepID=UPI0006D4E11F|nr:uncharacterized protein LOC106685163 isoform X2 [Halyomorpha halys]